MRIAVVGGGAAGMLCAINIKSKLKDKVDVTILERQNRLGKKLLMTGNGKCNLTNMNITVEDYNTDFVYEAIKQFSPQNCIDLFCDLGLMTRIDEEGRVYPYSEKANSVLEVLLHAINKLKIEVITDYEVDHIKKTDQFLVYSKDYQVNNFDYLVIATGGKSALNFENNSYHLLEPFNHKVTALRPGLVALKTDVSLKALSGLRVKAKATIIKGQNVLHSTVGEILFKDHGLSGIAIFELSRFYEPGVYVSLDLAYNLTDEELETFLQEDLETRLNGLFPKMICLDLLKRYRDNIIEGIRNYQFKIVDTYDYDNAQITVGGIDYRDVNPFTYESLLVKGLYIIGEALNVDGTCGGFNLHFAWASATLCANDITSKLNMEDGK
jgi:predicted Rossmann fold flavoprotein